MDIQEALAILKLRIPLVTDDGENDTRLDDALAFLESLAPDPKPQPITAYPDLPASELQVALLDSAYALQAMRNNHRQLTDTVAALYAADYQMPGLVEDLARFEAKAKELRSQIKTRHQAIIPLDIQTAAAALDSDLDASRAAFGEYLAELTQRLPSLDPSNISLGYIESAGQTYEVLVNKSADGGWEVTDPERFFKTLPPTHRDLFNVSVTVNTQKTSRADVNRWFEVETVTGTMRGVTRRPRIVHDLKEGELGIFTLRPTTPDEHPATVHKQGGLFWQNG